VHKKQKAKKDKIKYTGSKRYSETEGTILKVTGRNGRLQEGNRKVWKITGIDGR
jgi:hypothetical protein